MVTNLDGKEEKQIAVDIENDIDTKNKLNDIYGPKDTFLFMFIGSMTFLVLFFILQYFATINDGINVNFKYVFCNSNSNNSNSGVTDDSSGKFSDSTL